MLALRSGAFVLGLAVIFGAVPASAQDKAKPDRAKLKDRIAELKNLLPPDAVEKLKLTDEQKEKLAKLQQEFEEKSKETLGKIRATLQKAIQDKDGEAIRKAGEEIRAGAEKLRGEFMEKVAGLLTEEQKKKLEEIKKEAPARPGFRPGQPGEPRRPGPGLLLPPPVQEQLQLSDEQKEKLARLQKEVDSKLGEILTEEQKKKLEEIRQAGPPELRRRRPQN
jgi:Spy/CpxP family protein refolding chaperone